MAKTKTLDFTNVKEGGGQFNKLRQPAGDYRAKVVKVTEVKKKSDETKTMWLYTIKAGAGTYPYYCGFSENELWKIRNLFVAAGINVPKKKVKVDPEMPVGKVIGVVLEDDEYDGKKQSTVNAVFPASELEDSGEDDEDDEDDADDEDDEDNEEEEEEEDTDDEDDDEDDEEEEEEEAPPAKKKSKKSKKAKDDDLEELDIEDI